MNDYKEYIDKGIEEIHQGKFEDAIENITKSIELKFSIPYNCKYCISVIVLNISCNFVFVNFLDGAGWIGRQADMREIHRCSDYVLNFKNLGLLEDIIADHINDF